MFILDSIETSRPYAGFARVATVLVGDMAERLVYRAIMYARSDIGAYKPAPGDLAYPDKLTMMRNIAAQQQSENGNNDKSAMDMHALWYPTVRRTVLCLSKIYRCLEVCFYCRKF